MELDWVTFTLEVINFLVLVWILQHFLYKPVLATIQRRKAAIARDLAEAADRRKEADQLDRQFQQRLANWESEKETLRAKALASVEEERKCRMAALQADLDRENLKRRAIEQRQAEEERRKADQATVIRAGQTASALLRRLASPALEDRLVAVMIEDLGRLEDEQRQHLVDACAHADGKVEIASAFPTGSEARQAIVESLHKVTGRPVDAAFGEDPALVAGLRVTVGPLVLHANIADELEFFAESVANAR
jgi:F-type H+-transporting ATPase subunit b